MTQSGRESRLRFSNEAKLRRQMRKRGWTETSIREALATTPIPAGGKLGPAWRFVHPSTGQSVVVDQASGEIFHLGGQRYRYE